MILTRPPDLANYEGLIRKTAGMYAFACGMEPDDLAQELRLKASYALERYDGTHEKRLSEERFIFQALKNKLKDLMRDRDRRDRRRGGPEALSMTDTDDGQIMIGTTRQGRERFEERYLATIEGEVFGEVEEGKVKLPSTVTAIEARIIVLLMGGFTQKEIGEELGIRRQVVRRHQISIEVKLADWRPTTHRPLAA